MTHPVTFEIAWLRGFGVRFTSGASNRSRVPNPRVPEGSVINASFQGLAQWKVSLSTQSQCLSQCGFDIIPGVRVGVLLLRPRVRGFIVIVRQQGPL